MANPIIKIKRGLTAPTATLNAGEFAIDQAAKNLYLGVEVGGVTTNEIVGGSGTFATKTYVDSAVSAGTGSLGTMSTQNANAVAITGGAIDSTTIGATTPSTGAFTTLTATTLDGNINAFTAIIDQLALTNSIIDNTTIGATTPSTGAFTTLGVTSDITMSGSGLIDMNAGRITNLSAPVSANDAVRKTDLDSAVSALGSVFHYVGDVSAYTDASNPFELANIVDQSTGAYYRVDVAGTYTAGVGPSMEAKVGDAFVKTTTGWQKLDNVDAVVSGTANEISVTGDENAGYTVSIDPVFSGRMTTAESDITDLENKTQNFGSVAAGSTEINGGIWGNGSLTLDGALDIGGDGFIAGVFEVGSNASIGGNLTATGTVSGTNITELETKTQNITATANITTVAGVMQNGDGTNVVNFGSGYLTFSGTSDFGSAVVNGLFEVGGNALIGYGPNGGNLEVGGTALIEGNATFNGNIVGDGSTEIQDCIIDGGVY